MSCPHSMNLCPFTVNGQAGGACQYKGHEHDCPVCGSDATKLPTLNECIDIYNRHADVVVHRKQAIERVVKSIVSFLSSRGENITMNSPFSALTPFRIDEWKMNLLNTGTKPSSVNAYLQLLKSLSSEQLYMAYVSNKFIMPVFKIFPVKEKRHEVRIFTREEEILYRNTMIDFLNSESVTEQNYGLIMWFARICAVRNGDIARMTWGNFVMFNGKRVLRYLPRKTSKKSDVKSNIDITDEEWDMIAHLQRKPEDPIIKGRYEDPTKNKKVKNGFYIGNHHGMFSGLRVIFKERGIVEADKQDHMVIYRARRSCITEKFAKGGFQLAHKYGMNSLEIELKHYVSNTY